MYAKYRTRRCQKGACLCTEARLLQRTTCGPKFRPNAYATNHNITNLLARSHIPSQIHENPSKYSTPRILKAAIRHIEVAIAGPCAGSRKQHKLFLYTKILYFTDVANLKSLNCFALLPRRSAKDPIFDTTSLRASLMWQAVLFDERTYVVILQFKNQRLLSACAPRKNISSSA
jgi:hypothetical protein